MDSRQSWHRHRRSSWCWRQRSSCCSRPAAVARRPARLSRETRQRDDERRPPPAPSSRPSTELETTGRGPAPTRRARPRARCRRRARAAASSRTSRSTRKSSASPAGSSSTAGSSPALGLGVGGFGAACLGFLWPSSAGGFGGKVDVGSVERHRRRPSTSKEPVLHRRAPRSYIQPYPKDDVAEGEEGLRRRAGVLAGMEAGLRRAVPEVRAPRLPGAVVPDLAVVRVPVPRLEVQPGRREEAAAPRRAASTASRSTVVGRQHHRRHRHVVVQGPPIGTDTTGQGQEGAACV